MLAVADERRGKWPSETVEEVTRLFLEGVRVPDIQEQTGVPRATIYYLLNRSGARPQPRGVRKAFNPDDIRETVAWATEAVATYAERCGKLEAENMALAAQIEDLRVVVSDQKRAALGLLAQIQKQSEK